MDINQLAQRTLARLTPQAAEKLLMQHFRAFDVGWCQDVCTRPDVYRAALRDSLPDLPPDQRQHLERVWADIEYRLTRGADRFHEPTPDEYDLDASTPAPLDWMQVLIAPFDDPVDDLDIVELAITAGWLSPHPPHDYLIDVQERFQALAANGL